MAVQIDLFARRGGARPGAGRPPKGPRSSERHETREKLTRHTPVHITIRVVPLPSSLRTRDLYRAIRTATLAISRTQPMHIVHASIQSNHIHLIAEAADQYLLARGMQGFQISAAKHINRTLGRKGRVFQDRYHAHVLRTPRETRNAVNYVLNNWRKHGAQGTAMLDPFATGHAFSGWCEAAWLPANPAEPALHTWEPASWLLCKVADVSVFDAPA